MSAARLTLTLPNANGAVGKWTYSFWVKRSTYSSVYGEQVITSPRYNGSFEGKIKFNSDDSFEIYDYRNSFLLQKKTNRLFRDTNAWYHFVVNNDSTVSSPETEIYVNGVKETSFATSNEYSQNDTNSFNNDYTNYIGDGGQANKYLDGCLAHFHFVSGTKYVATDFGEFDSNGVWKPKPSPSITYGNNGYFLKFDNSGNMGLDSSGNTNNWTTAGTIKQIKDTPSNVHCVGNTLIKGTLSASTATNLNLTATSGQASWETLFGTLAVNSGKWYAEFKTGATGTQAGVIDVQQGQVHDIYGGSQSRGWGYDSDGIIYNNANNTGGTYASITAGDVIGVALDMDNHNVYFHKNGVYQNSGDPTSGASGTGAKSITAGYDYTFFFGAYNGNMSANFGNGHFGTTDITSAGSNGNGSLFEYDVPTGYYALNTTNLKDQS